MTAAYQDKRITITPQVITVGGKAFTMNLVNHAKASATKPSRKPPWKKLALSFSLTIIGAIASRLTLVGKDNFVLLAVFGSVTLMFAVCAIYILIRCLCLSIKPVCKLILNISGNDDTVLSSKDKNYIHMLAGLINTFKGYTPEPEPSFDYEGEVLE
jgi:hypothetical protein